MRRILENEINCQLFFIFQVKKHTSITNLSYYLMAKSGLRDGTEPVISVPTLLSNWTIFGALVRGACAVSWLVDKNRKRFEYLNDDLSKRHFFHARGEPCRRRNHQIVQSLKFPYLACYASI